MATKIKFNTQYDLIGVKNGTIHTMDDEGDKANQSRAEECSIKSMIEKYGIIPLQSMMSAKEPIFLNNITGNLVADEIAYSEKIAQVQEYFAGLPANVRKKFDDNPMKLYDKLQSRKYDQLYELNILTREMTGETLTNNESEVTIENPEIATNM